MKKPKLLGFLCRGDLGDCMPHTPQARSPGASGRGVAGGARTSLSQRREGGPLSSLGPRRPHGFEQGLDDWARRPTSLEEQRKKAAELIEKAESSQGRELTLSGLGLTRLTSQVGALSQLQALDLSHNKLSKLPASIGDLANLIDLAVDFNRLQSLPDEIENLSQLKHFSAQSNQLSQVPESMHMLMELTSVNLKSNQIGTLGPEWSGLLQRLRRLDLSDNKLKALPTPPDEDHADARADVRARTLDLDLSNNPIAGLPRSYGGFRYHKRFGDHVLQNAAGTIVVRTELTQIREGLVQQGRLAPGRGISARAAPRLPRERAALDADNQSIDSFGDYVRRHGEPGQSSGVEPEFSPPASSKPDQFGEQPEWTKPRAAENLDGEAGQYVDLGLQPPFTSNVHSLPQHPGAPIPGYGHAALPTQAPSAAPDLASVLAAELLRLPEPMRAAILSQLARVPPAVLEAELVRMQTAGWQGAAAGMPPAGTSTMGAAQVAPHSAAPQFVTQPMTQYPAPVQARFATQTVPPFPPSQVSWQVPPQFTTQAVPPSGAPAVPQAATHTVPTFVTPAATSGVQQPPTGAPIAGMAPPWTSTDQTWLHNAPPPPWGGADTSRFGTPQGSADPWAPPRWVAPDEPEETPAYAEVPESSAGVWASPPKAEIPMQPEEPGMLDLLEGMLRAING